MLALYGHPDSGGIWEKHCEDQLKTVGWTAVLLEIWQSIFYHHELDLLLLIYVDDFERWPVQQRTSAKGGRLLRVSSTWILPNPSVVTGVVIMLSRYQGLHILLHTCWTLTRRQLLQLGVTRSRKYKKLLGSRCRTRRSCTSPLRSQAKVVSSDRS